jgi:hypothetical protein
MASAKPRANGGALGRRAIVALMVIAPLGVAIQAVLRQRKESAPCYSTPEEAFEAYRDPDPRRSYESLTTESQEMAAGMAAFAAMWVEANDPQIGKLLDRHRVNRQRFPLDAYGTEGHDIEAMVRFHERLVFLGRSIDDKPRFYAAMARLLDKLLADRRRSPLVMSLADLKKRILEAELHDVAIDGDKASGWLLQETEDRVIERPIEFRKIRHGWRVHFPRAYDLPQTTWLIAAQSRVWMQDMSEKPDGQAAPDLKAGEAVIDAFLER